MQLFRKMKVIAYIIQSNGPQPPCNSIPFTNAIAYYALNVLPKWLLKEKINKQKYKYIKSKQILSV